MILLVIVLGMDVYFPLGTGLYVFHFFPVALTVLDRRKLLPYYVAIFATIAVIAGVYLTDQSAWEGHVIVRRFSAIITIWFVAVLVKSVVESRNIVNDGIWLRSGITDLMNRIRGDLTPQEITQRVLDFFADRINMRVGAIYIHKADQKILSFSSGYAFSGSDERKMIKFGEGLLGQCAVNLQNIEVNNLQKDYIKVSSSLGEETPKYLLITPLMAGNKLYAVMELAFTYELSANEKNLVHDSLESIAIAIMSSIQKVRLSDLLQKEQQLSEELQAQQEELRASNEELELQSKSLKENQIRLENQQAELEQSNQMMEEQTQTLENQKLELDEKNKELLLIQSSLREKASELEKSSKYKSEFLANMSHELRTPLNSSLILAKLLAENKIGNLTQDQIKYAEIIYNSGNDLLNLINDILDLSKVEAGKMSVRPEVVEIDYLSKSLEVSFQAMAREKNLDFRIELDSSSPKHIVTDRMRLEQILKNFLSNAFKFTEKGHVSLKIVSQEQGQIAFNVTDTGIGIASDKQEIIFEAFMQADGTTNRKYGGTGLGLSISRELARLLGGTIKVESCEGKGSQFTLILPFSLDVNEPESLEQIPTQTMSVKEVLKTNVVVENENEVANIKFSFQDDREKIGEFSRKILIIEDDENFARILMDLSHEMGFGALITPTADEGLKLAKEFIPEAVILDIRLPDHNGMIVLDMLKANPHTRHIPVHIISASDFSHSAREMGAVGYMLKPVKREQLQIAFNNLNSMMSEKHKQVLVVEDDPVQRDYIVQLISDPGIHIEAVSKATDALSKLASKTYDCMIMDLTLPDLSGLELLSKLSSENSIYSYPPVIVYTARDLTPGEEEKLRQYSGSIIIKGAKSPERLLSEVTLFLHRVETELPPERQKMLKELRYRDHSLQNKNILIVDDDIRNIFALTSALEGYGASIHVAKNGIEAIEKIKSTENLDLVLMDIMMPEMDGFEAMRKIREDKKYEKLSIIALTAKAMKDDQEKCLAAGANDYMAKPINMDKLLSLIKVWLPSHRSFSS